MLKRLEILLVLLLLLKLILFDYFRNDFLILQVYQISHKDKQITQHVPPSGIFSMILNEEDRLQIAGAVVHGEAEEATYIAHVIRDEFTVPPLPDVPQIPLANNNDKIYKVIHDYGYGIIIVVGGTVGGICLRYWCKKLSAA